MQFHPNRLYHIYNRGNNKQTVFFNNENYLFFLDKVRKYISPNSDILAWCLMPNHFHFLLHTNDAGCEMVNNRIFPINKLAEGFRLTLSSYCKAINVQEGRTGNLFQQKTKSKLVLDEKNNYSLTAFHYIHQNPLKAGLANKLDDWEYSSYKDYAGLRNGTLCNKQKAIDLLEINIKNFQTESNLAIREDLLSKIF